MILSTHFPLRYFASSAVNPFIFVFFVAILFQFVEMLARFLLIDILGS